MFLIFFGGRVLLSACARCVPWEQTFLGTSQQEHDRCKGRDARLRLDQWGITVQECVGWLG